MKKIFEQLKGVMCSGTYNHYRLILTPDRIELKLRPKSDKENEKNWVMSNTPDNRKSIYYQLHDMNKVNN